MADADNDDSGNFFRLSLLTKFKWFDERNEIDFVDKCGGYETLRKQLGKMVAATLTGGIGWSMNAVYEIMFTIYILVILSIRFKTKKTKCKKQIVLFKKPNLFRFSK